MEIKVISNVLKANDRQCAKNLEVFAEHKVLVVNVVGSPGAGKTTLLEALLLRLKEKLKIAVIEGDIFTTRDAERIEAHAVDVVQINTGGGCHLDAMMVGEALELMELEGVDLLIIENVGNLVCPAGWNLGEDFKMVVMSITEGDDKPEKYPKIFQESKVLAVTKVDLLAYNQFSMERFTDEVRGIQPEIEIFQVSSTMGDGMDALARWIEAEVARKKQG